MSTLTIEREVHFSTQQRGRKELRAGPAPAPPVEPGRLIRMRDSLRHRGPDGEGLYLQGPVGLGHRRLAIVDVARGQQPMSNEDGTVWITFNGEIYNHAELRADLVAKGHRFRSGSDSEVVVHLYEEVGARVPELLRGEEKLLVNFVL